MPHLAVLAAALMLSAAVHGEDIELQLRQKMLSGELISEGVNDLTVRVLMPIGREIRHADVVVPHHDILKRTKIASRHERFAVKLAETPAEPVALCGLAQWCYEQCLHVEASQQAQRALAIDPTMAWPRRILANCGFVEIDGAWVDESEWLAARDQVRLGERIVPIAMAKDLRALKAALSVLAACREDCASSALSVQQANEQRSQIAAGSVEAAAARAEQEAMRLKQRISTMANLSEKNDGLAAGAALQRDAVIDRIVGELAKRQLEQLQTIEASLRAQKTAGSRIKDIDLRIASHTAALAQAKASLASIEGHVRTLIQRLPADDPDVVAARSALIPPSTAPKP